MSDSTQDVNAQVNSLEFGSAAGERLGTYRQVGRTAWQEMGADGTVGFAFVEISRDDRAVLLRDESRHVDLTLDLERNIIVYADANQQFDLYSILSTSSRVNGRTATEAHFTSIDGHDLGVYRQTGDGVWCEFDQLGTAHFIFDETNRDDWSVYLHDTSRDVALQLDFHRSRVVYRHGGSEPADLYAIGQRRGVSNQPYVQPAVTGRTVNELTATGSDGSSVVYRQQGPHTWVELDASGQPRFHFTETSRTHDAVYLSDVSRHVTLGLHVLSAGITYTDSRTPRFLLYPISESRTKVHGRVANRVVFRHATDDAPSGEFRQVGPRSWVEMNTRREVTSRFDEERRDDWSVYLHDPSRGVWLQLDLHRGVIGYRDTGEQRDQYQVESASGRRVDLEPVSNIPTRGHNLRSVEFGDLAGRPLGRYEQVSETTWVEEGEALTTEFTFEETARTNEAVHLHDASRNVSLQLDLATERIIYTDANTTFPLYAAQFCSAAMHGRLVSQVRFGRMNGEHLGTYRQVDDGAWAEFDTGDNVTAHFQEVRRDAWSIQLHDPSRNVSVLLDVRSQLVMFGTGQATNTRLYKIISESVESGEWIHAERITSRSSMTQDFAPAGGETNPSPVYRTSVTLTSVTRHVDIWASRQVAVEIDGDAHHLDPVKPIRVEPSAIGKLSISIPADDLDCPTLTLRTNLMMPEQRHPIYPDIEAHKKIANLQPGALQGARAQLGIHDKYSAEDLDHFQRALKNVASTKQYTYNRRPFGVHHDRVLHPKNMEHPHFVVDLSGDGVRYQPLQPHEVEGHIAGARLLEPDVAQSFFGSIGHFFASAGKVVVHTVEAVGHDVVKTGEAVVHDVVQTAENVGHEAVHTFHAVGEDLVHGDILKAGSDLYQGGEHIEHELVTGAGHVIGDVKHGVGAIAGDVAEGAGQLVVMTLHAAEEIVQFVVTHTGFIGQAIGWLFEKIAEGIEKVVDWLLDKLGWGDILHTHDVLMAGAKKGFDDFAALPALLRRQADDFFGHLTTVISDDIDAAVDSFDVLRAQAQHHPVGSHSGATEKVEWFLGKLMQHAESSSAVGGGLMSGGGLVAVGGATAGTASPLDDLLAIIEREIGRDGAKISGAIEAAVGDISAIFTDPSHSPEYLLGALLEIVKAVLILGLDAINAVLDVLLDLLETVFRSLASTLEADWHIPFISDLYSSLTEGRTLSLLSAICLLIAIPTTIVTKAEFDHPPFETGAAANLRTQSGNVIGWGVSYGICHIALAPLSVFTDLRGLYNGFADAKNPDLAPSNTSIEKTSPKKDQILTLFDLGITGVSLLSSAPVPADEGYESPPASAKDNVLEAPNYWGHVAFWYLVVGLGVNTVYFIGDNVAGAWKGGGASKAFGNVHAVLNSLFGAVEIGLMCAIDVADGTKLAALAPLDALPVPAAHSTPAEKTAWLPEYRRLTDETGWPDGATPTPAQETAVKDWVIESKNYRAWGQAGRGRKSVGNVFDAYPAVGQLAGMPSLVEATEGLSFVGVGALDLLGHLGEGITYLVRTGNGGLL